MPLFHKTRSPENVSSIAKLQIQDKIGVGSFGEVFSACVKKDRRKIKYALKELDATLISKQGIVSQIRAEKNTMKKLAGHPSIVMLYSYWETHQKVYFLMEYCDAGDMFDRVRLSKKLSAGECARYLLQIASALDFVHDSKIIYRDLKLENILLKKQGDLALLADFGLSKVLVKKDGRTSTICGTIQYMAPELLNDEAYGQEIDWWSLGVTSYVMLTGRYPHASGIDKLKYDCSANDRVIMYKRISEGLLTFPEDLDDDVVQALRLLLTKDRNDRATSTRRLRQMAWLKNIHEVAPVVTQNSADSNSPTKGKKKKSRLTKLMRSLSRPRTRSTSPSSAASSIPSSSVSSPVINPVVQPVSSRLSPYPRSEVHEAATSSPESRLNPNHDEPPAVLDLSLDHEMRILPAEVDIMSAQNVNNMISSVLGEEPMLRKLTDFQEPDRATTIGVPVADGEVETPLPAMWSPSEDTLPPTPIMSGDGVFVEETKPISAAIPLRANVARLPRRDSIGAKGARTALATPASSALYGDRGRRNVPKTIGDSPTGGNQSTESDIDLALQKILIRIGNQEVHESAV